jgi:xylulokinase
LRPSVAQQLGLPAKITVAVGWGDLFSSMLSIRALSSADREFDITGTAEAGGASTRGAVPAPGLLSIPVRSQLNVTYGSTQAGGGSVDWLQKRILVGIDDAWINREVGQLRRVTAPSLLFLPHLGGERAPLWDRTIRGAFLGMDTTHDRADLARAVLEGVAYSIRQILMRVADARGYRLDTPVLIAGAASRNTTWNQIKADVLGRPVEVIPLSEPSAFGAAILGFVAAGHATDPFDVAERISKPGHVLDPDPRFRDHYDDLFALYDGSQANLASIHLGLEKVRGKGDSKRGQVEGN